MKGKSALNMIIIDENKLIMKIFEDIYIFPLLLPPII